MSSRWKTATGLTTALATAVLVGGMLISSQSASAQALDQQTHHRTLDRQTQQRIAVGYAATPVPVDLTGKDPLQVGIGSYIVNGTGICNHCHSVNQYYQAVYPYNVADPTPYASYTGDPYFLPPPYGPYLGAIVNGKATFVIDPTTFVAGGQNFGIVDSKNLTPAPNGNVQTPTTSTPYYAEGGIDWITYWGVLHNGVDIDQLYKMCNGSVDVGTGPLGCFPVSANTNAYVLQVMPWPTVRQLTDNDLNAVWQYLSAIPCNSNLTNENGPSGSNIANTYGAGVLINNCSPPVPESNYNFYQYVNGKIVPNVAFLVGAALLPVQPANAQCEPITCGISPLPAPSTPSCGLGNEDYPSCPPSDDDERIAEGFAIAPVPLNLFPGRALDPRKVGIGSYWMNSAGNCDGCHAGAFTSPAGQFTANGNPQDLPISLGGTYAYASVINPYNPPAIVNAAGYLAGGANFGAPNGACDSSGMGGCGPSPVDIIVRNLTPDFSTGVALPEGNTLEQFKETLRTGHDFQQVHLNCPPLSDGVAPNCVVPPSDGTKLQIMPWPALTNATDYDLESLYEYLSAIPCIANANSPYPQIIHTCPGDPQVKANYHKYAWVHGSVKRLN